MPDDRTHGRAGREGRDDGRVEWTCEGTVLMVTETTTTAAGSVRIECQGGIDDGWQLEVYPAYRGVPSVMLERPTGCVAIPVEAIPTLIDVLQRFVDEDDAR